MSNFSISTKELLHNDTISEIIYLEPEHFERAVEISSKIINENYRWKTYVSVLALCSFEEWLKSQVNDLLISADYSSLQHQYTTESTTLSYLQVGDFFVCLIVSETVASATIFIPKNAIDSPELVPHFYVVIEVLEEQEEVIIQGCLRYDKLINYHLTLIDDNYQLPLYLFNTEINHLLLALRLLSPTAIIPKIENSNITKLNTWLQNTFEKTWLAIEDLLDTALLRRSIVWQQAFYRSDEDNAKLRSSTSEKEIQELLNQIANNTNEFQLQKAVKRLGVIATGNHKAILTLINLLETTQDDETLWTIVESLWQMAPGVASAGVRRVKLIDLGMQVAGRTIALAVAILKKSNQQFGVLLRVYPTHDELYVPVKLKLILLDNGEILHEVIARIADNYIQLKLSGNKGETFSVKIMLEEGSITEHFEI